MKISRTHAEKTLRASRYNGGNPPSGSPVPYGGKPAFRTGSPQRAGLALRLCVRLKNKFISAMSQKQMSNL